MTTMKDCCRPDQKPGPVKRVLNKLTTIILAALAIAALLAVLF